MVSFFQSVSYSQYLAEVIKQRNQLELAKNYQESKRKNIEILQNDVESVLSNHDEFVQFVNDEEKSLNSTRDGIIYKVHEMNDDEISSYMKDTFNKTESSKVRYSLPK